MSYYQAARRLMSLRVYAIIVVVAVGGVMAFLGPDILKRFVRPCDAAPSYHADVPPDTRARIDDLFTRGLLYCSDPVPGLLHMNERVYWATDGVSSVLFFQAADVSDLGVVRYGFGTSVSDAFVPLTVGAAPIEGFREDVAGRPALANQAPEGSTYYYRLQGAPSDRDNVVAVTIRGTAVPQPGLSGRDVFRDLEVVWRRLRGSEEPAGDTRVQVAIPVLSEYWQDAAHRSANPDLVESDGRVTVRHLRDAGLEAPALLQTVSGPLGTTVWVAGVISGTSPALVLAPDESRSGATVEPVNSAGWVASASDDHLEHFAFEPLPEGETYEARYWNESRDRDVRPPDYTWLLTVP